MSKKSSLDLKKLFGPLWPAARASKLALWKALFDLRRPENRKRLETALKSRQPLSVRELSRLAAFVYEEAAGRPSEVRKGHAVDLFESATVMTPALEPLLDQLETLFPPKHQAALALVRANLHLEDQGVWLAQVNRYLSQFGLSPLELAPGGEEIFDRLTSPSAPSHEGGPLITVLMAGYNSERTVAMALNSIRRQTWENLQIVFVDDASTDGTVGLVQRLAEEDKRILVLRNRGNYGPYVSKNRALAQAQGQYFTCHDADDWAHPQWIERQFAFLQAEGHKIATNTMVRMTERGRFVRFSRLGPRSFDAVSIIAPISAMFETQYFRQTLGSWDCVRYGADSELIGRYQKLKGEFPLNDLPALFAMEREGSLTKSAIFGVGQGEGLSPPRLLYRDNFSAYHRASAPAALRYEFPPTSRPFECHTTAVVDLDRLRAELSSDSSRTEPSR